jgi:hypothetical protein
VGFGFGSARTEPADNATTASEEATYRFMGSTLSGRQRRGPEPADNLRNTEIRNLVPPPPKARANSYPSPVAHQAENIGRLLHFWANPHPAGGIEFLCCGNVTARWPKSITAGARHLDFPKLSTE